MVKLYLHSPIRLHCVILNLLRQSVSLPIPYIGNDRAVAQEVSRWLLIAVARVRVRAACVVFGGQSGTGAGFLRVLRFPLPIIIPPNSPSS
jgi:hypothetical protein